MDWALFLKKSPRCTIFLICLIISFTPLKNDALEKVQERGFGTLVVTYGTGEEALRLNRVRFWLITSQGFYRLFPAGNRFVEDPLTKKRMVLIDNLPVGDYTIKFIYPNSDNLFEKVDARLVSIQGGGVVKVDQDIRMKAIDIEKLAGTKSFEIAYDTPLLQIVPPFHGVRFYSFPRRDIISGYLNVRSNMPEAYWIVSKDGVRVVLGKGSVMDLALPPGSGYRLTVEELPNYEVKVLPPIPFTIGPSETKTIEILYKPILGTIQINTTMPSSDQITITIEGDPIKEPIQTTQIARGNQIDWKSPPLPLGTYILTIKTPLYYEEIPPAKILLTQGQNIVVKPKMQGANKISVSTNSSDAQFTLKQDSGPLVMEGKGESFQFTGLFPGTYTLSFSTLNRDRYISPPPMRIALSKFKPEEESLYAEYNYAGTLHVKGNKPHFIVKLESEQGHIPVIREEVTDYEKILTLPEGQWRVTFIPYVGKDLGTPLPAKDLSLDAFEREEMTVHFLEEEMEASLKETENLKNIDELYNDLLFVPAQLSILGDPYKKDTENTLPGQVVELSSFEISKYEVTNGQFAEFLNLALEKKIISLSNDKKGVVIDRENHPLFYTMEYKQNSQISYSLTSKENPSFQVLPGFENYPVIYVSWFGAALFCDYFKLRLPTEAEWERAASVTTEEGNKPIRKWIFGFSKDIIDRTLANYKYRIDAPPSKKVLTTPVGFFNGINTLPLESEDASLKKTEHAVSPIGAYDMSGNVFEWVHDWYAESLTPPLEKDYRGPLKGTLKVAKGGCYDSLAEGVRSFERIGLNPEEGDAYTGFRVVRDLNK